MKKIIASLLSIMLLISSVMKNTYAIGVDSRRIIDSDITIVDKRLEEVGYLGGGSKSFILYDNEENPSYLLGVCEKGYIILDRITHEIYEFGETNPYINCLGKKIYYSGPLNYFVESNAKYMNLRTNEISEKISSLNYVAPVKNKSTIKQIIPEDGGGSSTVRVSNSYAYIKRKAFGRNNDDTCSAVAVAITLNYLTLQTGKNFVPTSWRSENLSSTSFSTSLYPKANSLHRYIVDSCGMGAASIGQSIKLPFELYVSSKVSSSYNLKLSFGFSPSDTSIKNSINANKPVVITTLATGNEFAYHSMVAYGYRPIADGTMLLVHTGWYTDYVKNEGEYVQTDVYINSGFASCGHYFSYN